MKSQSPYLIIISLGSLLCLATQEHTVSVLLIAIPFLITGAWFVRGLCEDEMTVGVAVNLYYLSWAIHAFSLLILYWLWKQYPDPYVYESDNVFYYRSSFLTVKEYFAKPLFGYPGFYILNRLVTYISTILGSNNYYGNLQLTLLGGSLLAPIVYLLAHEVYGDKIGRLAGSMTVWHPWVILYSVDLLRDVLIAGGTVLVILYEVRRLKGKGSLKLTLNEIMATAVVYYLRYYSGIVIAITVLIIRWYKLLKERRLLACTLGLCLVSLIVAMQWARMPITKMIGSAERRFVHVLSVSQEQSFVRLMLRFPTPIRLILGWLFLHFIPVPFYTGWLETCSASRILIGLGGLYNQVVFGWFLIGCIVSVLRGEILERILVIGELTLSAALTYELALDARYLFVVTPLTIILAAVGVRTVAHPSRLPFQGMWLLVVLGIYVIYVIFK